MTTITANIVCDTIWPEPMSVDTTNGSQRITTMLLRYPRPIHAEFMTHRMFSRNASSSRAIPVHKLIEDVLRDPYIPIHWGKNQPGMQAREEQDQTIGMVEDWSYPVLDEPDDTAPTIPVSYARREERWLEARDHAVRFARAYAGAGYHKQIVNRLLEPFAHINVLVTATDWQNFFYQRDHPDAQPEIQVLAQEMRAALLGSTPDVNYLHLPFILDHEMINHPGEIQNIVKVSAARCARTSYMTHEGKEPDWDADLALSAKLSGEPPHLSPFEHQARWVGNTSPYLPTYYANLASWRSQRFCMERGWSF